jgi:hypothetical protein
MTLQSACVARIVEKSASGLVYLLLRILNYSRMSAFEMVSSARADDSGNAPSNSFDQKTDISLPVDRGLSGMVVGGFRHENHFATHNGFGSRGAESLPSTL